MTSRPLAVRIVWSSFFLLLAVAACKPKNGSDLQGIVGYGEDGQLRAFSLLPMRNLPTREFGTYESAGARHAANLATKSQFYGLVECTGFHTGNAEDWMNVVEERAAQGDLGILPNRHLIVTGDRKDAFDGTLPCRLLGRFLATMPEIDSVLGSVISNPERVNQRQFRLAQTIFLSLRGPTGPTSDAGISPLMQRYLDLASAHFGIQQIGAAEMKANLLSLDAAFNPCSTESPTLALPEAARSWKTINYACVQTTRQGGSEKVYRPGGSDGRLYVDVRNFVAAELALVHLRVLTNAKALDRDLHRLINLLSSTADWTNIKKDSDFHPLARFLSTNDQSGYDFAGVFGDLDVERAQGFSLADDVEADDPEFELYPAMEDAGFSLGGSCSARGAQGSSCGISSDNKSAWAPTTKTATPSTLLVPRGYVEASTRDLATFLGKSPQEINADTLQRFQTRNLSNTDLRSAKEALAILNGETGATRALSQQQRVAQLTSQQRAAFEKLRLNSRDASVALSKGLSEKFGNVNQDRLASSAPTTLEGVSRSLEVRTALSQLKDGQTSVKVGNKEFEYLGERKVSADDSYLAMREKGSGAYHFVDKSGSTQTWSPLPSDANNPLTKEALTSFQQTNGAAPSIFREADTNRFQAVSLNERKEPVRTLGIMDATNNVMAYPTVSNGSGDNVSVAIDWKSEKSQQQIVQQLADTVETRRNQFTEEFRKTNPNVSPDTINSLFKMSNSGMLPTDPTNVKGFQDQAKVANLTEKQMSELGFRKEGDAFVGTGEVASKFMAAKAEGYDRPLNQDLGKMLTTTEQAALGINPANGNPDQAITQAFTDTGFGKSDQITLKDNLANLSTTDQQLFQTVTPPTNPPPAAPTRDVGAAGPTLIAGDVAAPTAPSSAEASLPASDQFATSGLDTSGLALTGTDATGEARCNALETEAARADCREKLNRK